MSPTVADLALIRAGSGLVPATDADREIVSQWKLGQVVHGKYSKMRNAAFHGKFFAMLSLAFEYYEPVGGLIPTQELRGIKGLARFMSSHTTRPDGVLAACEAYIEKLEADRAEKFPVVDKSREAFREWVTVEAGHFSLVQTPAGIRKEAKSIAWAAMDETAFSALYRDVFAVCWRLVLSSHFDTESDAMAAADTLGSFA